MKNREKKTVFLTVSVGMLARNVLNNRFYERLTENYNVVMLTPLHSDPEFVKTFARPGVTFRELKHVPLTRAKVLMKGLHGALIYNITVHTHTHHGLSFKSQKERTVWKRIKTALEYVFFGLFLSRIPPVRDFARWIDKKYFTEDWYHDLFQEFKPAAVFVTNVCLDDDVQLVRAAKRHGVPTLGMTKSWDNFSQNGIREKTDVLAVWSAYMQDEAVRFQNYKKKDIRIVGVPQFDLYADIKRTRTREDFLRTYGLDPKRKVILFGQEAPIVSPDDPYVVTVIRDWIIENRLPYQILIRPHFGHKGAVEAFDGLADGKVVFLDDQNKKSNFRGGAWDHSTEHHERLALSMGYSDAVVTSTSTLALDAIASGTETFCYAFDKKKNLPPSESMTRFYSTAWFTDLRKHGLERHILKSEKALLEALGTALSAEVSPYEGDYRSIRDRFCYKVDGQSGERLFEVLSDVAENKTAHQ